MTDVKYNYNWVLDAKAQREADPIEDTPKGIAAKPAEQDAPDEKNFLESMYDRLVGGFTDEEEAIDAMSSKKPSREAVQSSVLDEMEELLPKSLVFDIQSDDLTARMSEYLSATPPATEEAAPVTVAPDDVDAAVTEALEELEPEGVASADVDAAVSEALEEPAATQGVGLMSPPAEEAGEDTTEVSTYSSTTNAVYTDFYDNNEEGDVAHVGQDSQNLTLPAGIVADGGVTYDGKEVKAGKNTVKSSAFDVSKVDMSKAYKKVGGKTYKREDYDSYEAWSKAVIEGFKDVVKDKAGSSWDSLTDTTKQAVTKLAWNNGEAWAKYNTSQALYKELAKDTKDKKIIADGILNYSTVSGSGASIGVAKARANAWNKMSDAHGFAEITKITADNTGAKTKFNYYDAQGNLIHTETTSRASSKYANKATEVEKDAQGDW